jgi:hypothetical protein
LIGLGFSVRKGGTIRAESGDTVKATAHVPDHYGASLEYTGWGDAALDVHVGRDQWSAMKGLAGPGVTAYNSWDVGGGAEATGPRIIGHPSALRIGVSHRTLPFSTTGSAVSELSISGGLGLDLARNRARLDIALTHADRGANGGVKEHAYILSFGLRVVP